MNQMYIKSGPILYIAGGYSTIIFKRLI